MESKDVKNNTVNMTAIFGRGNDSNPCTYIVAAVTELSDI